jgi:hypothetical protein
VSPQGGHTKQAGKLESWSDVSPGDTVTLTVRTIGGKDTGKTRRVLVEKTGTDPVNPREDYRVVEGRLIGAGGRQGGETRRFYVPLKDVQGREAAVSRPEAPANEGLAQRAERTAEKASLRAMSDADLRAAYRQASGLDAKRYQAEIDRRNNLVTAPAGDSITRHTNAPVSVDIFESGAGQLDVGPVNNRTVYDIYRDGGEWHADRLEGPDVGGGQHSAGTVAALARKIADAHGVSGAVSIEDERGKGRSLTQRFEHTAKATPIPVGATDADRARLRPRREGETDLAYSVRNAPSDFAAENILKGYNLPGLRAVARAEGVTVPAGATKPQIVSLLLDAMRRRDRDARAVGQRVEPNRAHPDLVYPGKA